MVDRKKGKKGKAKGKNNKGGRPRKRRLSDALEQRNAARAEKKERKELRKKLLKNLEDLKLGSGDVVNKCGRQVCTSQLGGEGVEVRKPFRQPLFRTARQILEQAWNSLRFRCTSS